MFEKFFKSRQEEPARQKFLNDFRRTITERRVAWNVLSNGFIRATVDGVEVCPGDEVVYLRTGKRYGQSNPMWKYYFQGTIGEMPSWLCFEIACASDSRNPDTRCLLMRQRILEIVVEEQERVNEESLELVAVE